MGYIQSQRLSVGFHGTRSILKRLQPPYCYSIATTFIKLTDIQKVPFRLTFLP